MPYITVRLAHIAAALENHPPAHIAFTTGEAVHQLHIISRAQIWAPFKALRSKFRVGVFQSVIFSTLLMGYLIA